MLAPATPPNPKRKFRRIATILAIVLLAPPALVAGTAWYYSRPERLARILEDALGENIHGSVRIDRAHLSWRGTLKVEHLRIGLAGKTGPYAQVLDAPLATIRLSRRQLLRFNPVVYAIEMESPVVHLVENPATGRVNWLGLGIKDTGARTPPPPLPLFALRHGKISFEQLNPDGLGTTVMAVWELDGTLTPTPGTRQAAKVALTAKRPDGKLATLTGSFNLAARWAQGELKGGCLRPEFALLLPNSSRNWVRMLGTQGEMPLLSGKVDWSDGLDIRAARAQMREVVIHPNIRPLLGTTEKTPAGNLMAAAADQLWFDGINGEAVVENNLLRLPDLRATAHGEALGFGTVAAKLSGQLGLFGKNPWSVAFTTESFELADKIPILEVFPDVRTIYQRFSPAGTFRASGRAEADSLTAVPQLEARVELIDAKANYAERPYPVEHLTGTLIATLDSIQLENLRGHGVLGGTVTVAGKVAPLTDAAGADITVGLADVPYGEPILKAMGQLTADAVRGFLSLPATEALRARNLPAPAPGGLLNASLHITRAMGAEGHWGILADVNPAGLQVILPQWPYPMKIQEGRVVADETSAKVTGVKAVGPRGGTVAMTAQAGESGPRGHWGWRVDIQDADLPVDDWFYASLPRNAEHAARQVGVEGRVHVTGSLNQDPGDAKDPELHINLHGTIKDGSANPFGAGYKFDKLAMDMTLHAGDFSINHAEGGRAGAVFSAKEKVSWAPAFHNLLTVSAENLPFEAALAKLAPPASAAQKRITDLFAQWDFKGAGNADFRWETGADDAQTVGIEVSPNSFSMRSPTGAEERLALHEMTGQAAIDDKGVRLRAIAGRFTDGNLSADGLIAADPGGDPDIDLKLAGELSVHDGLLPDTLLALLPRPLAADIEATDAGGQIGLTGGRLRIKGQNTDFKALLAAKNLNFDLGLPLRKTTGSAQLHTAVTGGQTATQADLKVVSADLWDRRLTAGKAQLTMDADGAWRLAPFSARLAEGYLNGSAAGAGGAWAMDADLADAAFDGIKNPGTWNGKADAGGILSARARLRNGGEGFSRLSGEGNFDLKLADLADKSGNMRLVEILNLVSTGKPINQANGRFTAHGATMVIDDVTATSPSGLTITGAGTVTLPDTGLDLRLKTHNQAGTFRARLAKALQSVTNEILGLRVTGTLENPEATANMFTSFKSIWRELLPGADDAAQKVKRRLQDELRRRRRPQGL